jgi:hypothetical protein
MKESESKSEVLKIEELESESESELLCTDFTALPIARLVKSVSPVTPSNIYVCSLQHHEQNGCCHGLEIIGIRVQAVYRLSKETRRTDSSFLPFRLSAGSNPTKSHSKKSHQVPVNCQLGTKGSLAISLAKRKTTQQE